MYKRQVLASEFLLLLLILVVGKMLVKATPGIIDCIAHFIKTGMMVFKLVQWQPLETFGNKYMCVTLFRNRVSIGVQLFLKSTNGENCSTAKPCGIMDCITYFIPLDEGL